MQVLGDSSFTYVLGFVSAVVGLVTTVFWLVVGWRAMRAHEEIAALLRERRGPPA
jgi:uncharacterized membrane protein